MAIGVATRAAILFAWAGKCFYCGREAGCVDHIVPNNKRGTDEPHNLIAACVECNRVKGDLWLPLAVLEEALEAAQKLAPFVTGLVSVYKTSLLIAVDRLNYGSAPLREGTPGRPLAYRAVRRMRAARDLAVDAAEIAQRFGVQKAEKG